MNKTEIMLSHLEKGISRSVAHYNLNGLKKGSYFEKFARLTTEKEFTISEASTEAMKGVEKIVNEGDNFPDVTMAEGHESTASAEIYGGRLVVTLKMVQQAKDNTIALAKAIEPRFRQLKNLFKVKLEREAHALINAGFATDADTTLAPDAKPLFATDHSFKTPGSTPFSNVLPTGVFSEAVFEEAQKLARNFKDSAGKPFEQNLNALICAPGSKTEIAAKKLFKSKGRVFASTVDNVNIYEADGDGFMIISTPYIKEDRYVLFDKDNTPLRVNIFNGIETEPMERDNKNGNYITLAHMFAEAWVSTMPYAMYGAKVA